MDRAHLLPQRVLKRELGEELGLACAGCGAGAWSPCVSKRGKVMKGFHGERRAAWLAILWSPDVWVWACRAHHHRLDVARTVRLPRWRVPPGTERFAEEHGLVWWLDRSYGDQRGPHGEPVNV